MTTDGGISKSYRHPASLEGGGPPSHRPSYIPQQDYLKGFGKVEALRVALPEIARAWRRRMPLSDLAEILHVDRKTIRRWIRGAVPQASLLSRIGNGGGVDAVLDSVLRGLAEREELERKTISLLPATSSRISLRLGVPKRRITMLLKSLESRGMVYRFGNTWKLTEKGWREAVLVGAKRGWGVEFSFEVRA